MKKFNPEMIVVRFGNEDVIATSGMPSFTASKFGNGTAGDANLNYNGTNYVIGTDISAADFLSLVGATSNAGVDNGESTMSFNKLVRNENTGTGVSSKRWNGTYYYHADETWNNGNQDILGVFRKQ